MTMALLNVEIPLRGPGAGVFFMGPEIFSEKDIPVPGTDTVLRTPRLPTLTLAPRPPSVVLTPDFDTFMRMPGAILMRLLKRNAIADSRTDAYEQASSGQIRSSRDAVPARGDEWVNGTCCAPCPPSCPLRRCAGRRPAAGGLWSARTRPARGPLRAVLRASGGMARQGDLNARKVRTPALTPPRAGVTSDR